MTLPRIVSSEPPATQLFPPLPDAVEELIGHASATAPAKKRDGKAFPLPDADFATDHPVLAMSIRGGGIVFVLWSLYATLVVCGVPLPIW